MTVTIKGNKLVIEADIADDLRKSSTGKNLLLVSETVKPDGIKFKGKQVKVQVNAYIPVE